MAGTFNAPPSEVDMDEALALTTGTSYRFQIAVQITMFYLACTTNYNTILSFFSGTDLPWRCVSSNSSHFCKQHINKSIHSYSDGFHERCKMNRSAWTFATDKHHSFVTEFELICDKTSSAALISSSYYIGGFVGTVLSGRLADAYGRKPVILISLTALICSSIGCSFVTSVLQFLCLNVIRGAAGVSTYYPLYVYLSEYAIPRFRAISTCQLLLAGPISSLLIDLFAYYQRDWRKLHLYASIPATPCLILIYLLPESARWLLANNRKHQASVVVNRINEFNGNAGTSLIHLKSPDTLSDSEKKYSYLDLLRSCKVFQITLRVVSLWFAVALVFFTIALGSANLGGDRYEAFALSTLADIPACFLCMILLKRIGRKRTVLGGMFTSGVLMGCMALVPRSLPSRFTVNMVLSVVGRFTTCIAFDSIITWTSELFPTVVRSQGMSMSVIFERLGMTCCPFVTRLLQSTNALLPPIIMCVLSIAASLFGLALPETNNRPTRERYEDFFEMQSASSSHAGIDNVAHDNINE